MLRQIVVQIYDAVVELRWVCNAGVIYFTRKLIGDVIFENFFSKRMHIKLYGFFKSPVVCRIYDQLYVPIYCVTRTFRPPPPLKS